MEFGLQFRHSNGNLHVKAVGGFDGKSARALLELFIREYPEGGRVFVDTEAVSEVHPSGRSMLSSWLGDSPVPADALFFMGEKGFQMAPDGTRVLIVNRQQNKNRSREETDQSKTSESKHRCCGKCAHCTCRRA